jgi:hypothetical protein
VSKTKRVRRAIVEKESPAEREAFFWSKINFNGPLPRPELGRCWLWTGEITKYGYGVFCIKTKPRRHKRNAHRWIYEQLKGKVPEGFELDHLCRTRNCVRLNHLEVVTSRENTLRGFGPTAINARKTHCLRGHELSGNNIHTNPNKKTYRYCRACMDIYNSERRKRGKW